MRSSKIYIQTNRLYTDVVIYIYIFFFRSFGIHRRAGENERGGARERKIYKERLSVDIFGKREVS